MILTTHALSGAVIGKNVNNLWLIIVLSIALHFILDTFRHGEYLNQKSSAKETFWKVALDISGGLTIIILISSYSHFQFPLVKNVLIGTFFSMFPDLLTFLYWKGKINFLKKIYKFHAWLHRHPPFSPERDWNLRNAVNDIIISAIAIFLLLL